jgi:hypothetical protein
LANTVPKWVIDSIHADLERPEQPGFWRKARGRRCSVCRATVLAGLDDDCSTAERATVDPTAVSALGEAWAVADGRVSYRLSGSGVRMLKLWRRDSWDIWLDVIGTTDSLGVVQIVVAHRCGKSIPEIYRATGEETR